MKHLMGRRGTGIFCAVLAVGFLASGCDWYQLGGNTQLNGDDSGDTAITPSNVSTLTEQFAASDASSGTVTPQAVVNGILYASDASGLEAYSATGSSGCSGSPTTCAPFWSYPGVSVPVSGGVAVLNGVLYVTTATALEAFDAAGHTNCTGTPTTCSPVWHATLTTPSAPTVSNGMIYVAASGTLNAFNASGDTNCAGGVCSPVWTASDVYGDVAVSAGVAYASGGNGMVAFDATGAKDCSGTLKVCTPLWSYAVPESSFPGAPGSSLGQFGYPVISGTTVFLDTFAQLGPQTLGGLEAFDANGVNDCSGTPIVCTPLWTAGGGSEQAPLAAGGYEFQHGVSGLFGALNGQSVAWISSIRTNPVAIGGSVLYASDGIDVTAFDVNGCGSASQCGPLWSTPGTDAIVANNTLYVATTNASGAGEIVAYGLP